MEKFDSIVSWVRNNFPEGFVLVDRAETPTGSSFMDLRIGPKTVHVEFRPGTGFGISTSRDMIFGEGPEVVSNEVDVMKRIIVALNQS